MTSLRTRLMTPPNAVPDTGITMRNGWPVRPLEPKAEPPKVVARVEPPVFTPRQRLRKEAQWKEAQRATRSKRHAMLQELAAALETTAGELRGPHRYKPLVYYRQGAVAIMNRLLPGESTTRLAQVFGRRDHTTIIHAIKVMRPHIQAIAREIGDDTSPSKWAQAMRMRIDAHSSHARSPCPADRDHGGQAGF